MKNRLTEAKRRIRILLVKAMKMNIYNKASKDMKQIWNRCFTSTKVLLIVALVLFSTMLLASILNSPKPIKDLNPLPVKDSVQVWIPTKEDIEYQDSMFAIIQQTQLEVDTIKEAIDHILYKLDRIEYSDGSWDSIRVPIRSDEHVMWIGGDGDTIWE